jgi:hypothetical protein
MDKDIERLIDEFNKIKDNSKAIINWLIDMPKRYPPKSINEFRDEILPYENLKLIYTQLEQAIFAEVDPKDFETVISLLRSAKIKLSAPLHSEDKTKDLQQYEIGFLQNIICLLEENKQTNNYNSIQQKDNPVDNILNSMFDLEDFQLKTLKSNLNGGRQYISLTYIGTKARLWIDLGKLLSAGIDRKEITRVFSEYCYWQKSTSSPSVKLKDADIYKKIAKKGIK